LHSRVFTGNVVLAPANPPVSGKNDSNTAQRRFAVLTSIIAWI
jgi:hypothetical protein